MSPNLYYSPLLCNYTGQTRSRPDFRPKHLFYNTELKGDNKMNTVHLNWWLSGQRVRLGIHYKVEDREVGPMSISPDNPYKLKWTVFRWYSAPNWNRFDFTSRTYHRNTLFLLLCRPCLILSLVASTSLVFSTITTASAPGGTGAPVLIRTISPLPTINQSDPQSTHQSNDYLSSIQNVKQHIKKS